MNKAQTFAIFAALSLSSASAATPQQPAANPSATIDTVEVTAQREAKRKAIQAYVENVTRFDGDNIARWRVPICVRVAGIAPEHGDFMRTRIVEIAKAVGAPLAEDQEKCSANLSIALTQQPADLWMRLKERNPKLFNALEAKKVERALSTRPVQAVQNIVLNNSDGTTPSNRQSYRLKDSHIYDSVTEDFTSVFVVVHDAETGKATFGQLSDYVGMAALARVDLSADFAAADSILRLFATSGAATAPPAKLTEFDWSFLKTLYGVDISAKRPRSMIQTTMVTGLVPEPR
jgi:hypothetical protein